MYEHIDRLVQERRNFSVLAMELRLSCTIWQTHRYELLLQLTYITQASAWTMMNDSIDICELWRDDTLMGPGIHWRYFPLHSKNRC